MRPVPFERSRSPAPKSATIGAGHNSALPLADRLRIAAVDLAVTGAPRALVEAVCQAVPYDRS